MILSIPFCPYHFVLEPLEALPTQHGYYVGVSCQGATGNFERGLVQGPHMAAKAGVETTTLGTKDVNPTNEPPRLTARGVHSP